MSFTQYVKIRLEWKRCISKILPIYQYFIDSLRLIDAKRVNNVAECKSNIARNVLRKQKLSPAPTNMIQYIANTAA